LSWSLVGPPVATLVVFAEVGARMQPPAPGVARWCFHTAAILLVMKLSAWMATSFDTFRREERLAAFVMLCAIGVGWYGANLWVGEREFDYLVVSQDTNLRLSVSALSVEILAFVAARAHDAPPPPRPPTWDRDEAAFDRYETATVAGYDARFGKRVRSAHDALRLLGVVDKDLDVFYGHPANLFQIQIVGSKLGSLAARIPTQ
jgi:hypothetical protein